jgi:hypothetical protein
MTNAKAKAAIEHNNTSTLKKIKFHIKIKPR